MRYCAIANHFGPRLRHVIVAMDGKFGCQSRMNDNLQITLLPIEDKKIDTLGNRRRFRELLRSIRPDYLVTHNWGTIEWAMANWPRLVPHVHVEDGFGPDEATRQFPRRALMRRLILRSTTVVVPSRLLEDIAIRVWKLRRGTLRYIPNGINCARFADENIQPFLPRRDGPIVGTVAALRAEKNFSRMLEAFRLVRNEQPCTLVIAGDGAERARLEARCAELGLSDDVLFVGYRADTERIYASLDVFALSSDTEQMPITVIEAMAAGLPVASMGVGDIGQMVASENRPYVAARDAGTLAWAILKLLENPKFRQQIGHANQAMALRTFSDNSMFAAYGKLFGAAALSA